MQNTSKISVIIVNYNSGSYAKDCILSLLKQQSAQLEIIVIDNASVDDSVALLESIFKHQITLIQSAENLGFGRANNLGAAHATGEFLLLLNPDTVIESPDVVQQMVDYYLKNNLIGLLAPLIVEPRKNKQVLPRYSYPSSKQLQNTNKINHLPGDIAWVLGACMLIKRSVFNEINGFDPDYFLYGEDTDICLRLRLVGYEIGFINAVNVMHVSGASEIGANTLDKWLRKRRGLFLFFKKHYHADDVTKIAKAAMFKSQLYLMGLGIKSMFYPKGDLKFLDQKSRLQATVIAAKEVLI